MFVWCISVAVEITFTSSTDLSSPLTFFERIQFTMDTTTLESKLRVIEVLA